jgi:uncharacterized membrane protein HdeD (DUF308 family)
METKHFKNWWFLAVNGVLALFFGLLLMLFSKEIILGIVFFSGLAIALGGLCFLLIAIYYLKKDRGVGMLILQSIFSLAIGVGIMIFRDKSLQLFIILIGVWAIIVGIFQLVILVNVKQNLSNKNFILINGLLTIALGIVMIIQKEEVPVFLLKILGGLAAILGFVMIYLSFVIRKTTMMTKSETDPMPR